MAQPSDAIAAAHEDAELMRRVQAADETALGALMERWERPVKAVIARLVMNSTDAEELAQETFVRVWQHRERYQRDRPVKPWLLGIAVNLARNRLRWWKRRPMVSLDEWTELPASDIDESAGASKLERSERAEAVRQAIAALSPDYREAIILFEYEHMSYADIASTLGISSKAVENRILRGREKLKSALRSWL